MQHLRAGPRQLHDLLVGDGVQLAGPRDDARIGGEDPVHVLEDLAAVGLQGHGQGHRRGVGRPPPGTVMSMSSVHPWKPATMGMAPRLQLPPDAGRVDLQDVGLGVEGVGDDPGLEPGQGRRVVALVVQGHRGQGRGDHLSGRPQQGHLPVAGLRRDLAGQGDQVVRGVPHGGDHGHHLRPRVVHPGDPRATPLIRSALATEVPPYFCTISPPMPLPLPPLPPDDTGLPATLGGARTPRARLPQRRVTPPCPCCPSATGAPLWPPTSSLPKGPTSSAT